MADDDLQSELDRLRADNDRLRRMLAAEGVPTELRHRVNNTFSMFRAIVRRSAETGHSTEDFAAHLDGRLDAMLRLHNAIMGNLTDGIELYTILADELLAHAVHEGPQIQIAGSEVRLPGRTAEIMGLAIHELTVNAIKFGALTRPDAQLDIHWMVEHPPGGERHLAFAWDESGLSDVPATPPLRGFGTEVLTVMLPYQLKARVDMAYRPDGLRCRIDLPLPVLSPETELMRSGQ